MRIFSAIRNHSHSILATIWFLVSAACLAGWTTPPAKELRPFVVSDIIPAKQWMMGHPVGNGHLGAMPFGGYPEETIVLNDNTVWTGRSVVHAPPEDAAKTLSEIRTALFQDDFKKSEELINGKLLVPRSRSQDYQPIGNLRLGYEPAGKCHDYRRTLSLNDAVSVTEFTTEDGNQIRQEVIVSHPANVIAVRIESKNGGKLSLHVGMDRFKYFKTEVIDAQTLGMSGVAQVEGDCIGTAWQAVARILPEGGKPITKGNQIAVTDAFAITILVTTSTDYDINNSTVPLRHDRLKACLDFLKATQKKPYAQLKADHIKDHHTYFDRATLDLGNTAPEVADKTTPERLELVRKGGTDPDLTEDLFQMGRYLLISTSRPGNLPAGLTGVWQGSEFPRCWSDFHFNINVQENYWPAELTNLSELHAPLIDFIESVKDGHGRLTAGKFGCRGFTMKTENTAWKDQAYSGNSWWGMAPQNAPWACQHVMEHFYFTRDKDYLAKKAYPILEANVEFIVDWLVKDPRTGKLVSGPSVSPENGFFPNPDDRSFTARASMGPAIDREIFYESFIDFLAASKELGIENELTREVRSAMSNLARPQIAKDGRLLEWDKDYKGYEDGHRHFSHLYAVHPGCEITPDTPELFEAARKSLHFRLTNGSAMNGWSRAWVVNIEARLLEAENAYRDVQWLIKERTICNLMHIENPTYMYIDGSCATTAGIVEMVLQSHGQDHVVNVLPALPKAWPTGSFAGFCGRGGFDIDLTWKDGKPTHLVLLSKAGEVFRLKSSGALTVMCHGKPVEFKTSDLGISSFPTRTGAVYEILFTKS